MKSRMHLGAALEDRLRWQAFPITATEERETFGAMCAAWAEYQRREASDATVRGRAKRADARPAAPPQTFQRQIGRAHV